MKRRSESDVSSDRTGTDRDSYYEDVSEREVVSDMPTRYGDTDDDGDTPLLDKDASARTYDTTQIGGSVASVHDDDRSNSSSLTDEEESEEKSQEDIMAELDEIQRLVLEAQDLEREAKRKVNKMPRWAMYCLVTFFTIVGATALVTGLLYVFDSFPAASSLLFWIVIGVSLGGNCLASFALFYSGSFKTQLKELAKGIKKFQSASDSLKKHVKVLTKHRAALTKSHKVLKTEITKLKDEVEKIESNQGIMEETKERIHENTEALQDEILNLRMEKDNLSNEKERYDESVEDMVSSRKVVEDYNRSAEERVGELCQIVETLKESRPQLDDQLYRFRDLREDVEKISNVMGEEVDQTARTVREIFDEIRELTIRQERVMLYQMMERIIGTTETRDMGHEQFKRFLLQIPVSYAGHSFDDRWFGEVAVDGRIAHAQLKLMIDTITLTKVSQQASAKRTESA